MKKIMRTWKKTVGVVLAIAMFASMQVGVYASNIKPQAIVKDGSVSFYNLQELKENQCVSTEIIDNNGNPAQVGIELVKATKSRSSSAVWRVYYDGLFIHL